MNNKELKDYFQSKTIRALLVILGIAIILLVIFRAGVEVGYRQALYSGRFGDRYQKTFINPHGPGRMVMMNTIDSSHDAVGQIIKIDNNLLTIKAQDGTEKIISLTASTTIRKFRDTIHAADLHIDDSVVVFGIPSVNGDIEAKLIRIVPAPFDMMPPPQTTLQAPTSSSSKK